MAGDLAPKTYLTPEVLALIGVTSAVREMFGVVDAETVRRYALGIPDQDPRYWEEALAEPRYGSIVMPPLLYGAMFRRRPIWDTTTTEQDREREEDSDGMRVAANRLRQLTGLKRHLNGGSEFELFRYPKLGDHLFAQSRTANIEEQIGRNGEPFLVITNETRYWNQDDETIALTRSYSIAR